MGWDFPGAARDARPARATARPACASASGPRAAPPARGHTQILAQDGTGAGEITSGGFGPPSVAPIAMGYVRSDLAADGTR